MQVESFVHAHRQKSPKNVVTISAALVTAIFPTVATGQLNRQPCCQYTDNELHIIDSLSVNGNNKKGFLRTLLGTLCPCTKKKTVTRFQESVVKPLENNTLEKKPSKQDFNQQNDSNQLPNELKQLQNEFEKLEQGFFTLNGQKNASSDMQNLEPALEDLRRRIREFPLYARDATWTEPINELQKQKDRLLQMIDMFKSPEMISPRLVKLRAECEQINQGKMTRKERHVAYYKVQQAAKKIETKPGTPENKDKEELLWFAQAAKKNLLKVDTAAANTRAHAYCKQHFNAQHT